MAKKESSTFYSLRKLPSKILMILFVLFSVACGNGGGSIGQDPNQNTDITTTIKNKFASLGSLLGITTSSESFDVQTATPYGPAAVEMSSPSYKVKGASIGIE